MQCMVSTAATACSAYISGHSSGPLVCAAPLLLCNVHQKASMRLLLSLCHFCLQGHASLLPNQVTNSVPLMLALLCWQMAP